MGSGCRTQTTVCVELIPTGQDLTASFTNPGSFPTTEVIFLVSTASFSSQRLPPLRYNPMTLPASGGQTGGQTQVLKQALRATVTIWAGFTDMWWTALCLSLTPVLEQPYQGQTAPNRARRVIRAPTPLNHNKIAVLRAEDLA